MVRLRRGGVLLGLVWLAGMAMAAATAAGCAALTGLSDLQRDDCAFGCDGGQDGAPPDSTTNDGSQESPPTLLDGRAEAADVASDVRAEGAVDGPVDGPVDSPGSLDGARDAPPESASLCGTLGQACCGSACNAPLTCQVNRTCGCGAALCNGACIDEANDPGNCGGCGHACAAGTNQTATCSAKMCGTSCNAGYADCADAGTACATSTAANPSNCGSCGHACTAAGQVCTGGACACPSGQRLCASSNRCADVTSDPNNCGSCAHSCLGGTCIASVCQPVTLASGVTAPVGIALDSSYVYFTSPTDGTVSKVPVGGGAVVPIATGQVAPTGVAVDGVNVYWAQNGPTGVTGGVSKAALPNGSPVPLVTGVSAFYLVSNGTNVYFTRGQNGPVLEVSVNGGSTTPIWTGNKYPEGIAIDATNVYWGVLNNNLGVYKAPVATGSPVSEFVSGYSNTVQLATDGTNVYFTTYLMSGGVYKTDPSGTNVVPLATGLARPFGVAVDTTHAYVTTLSAVVRVPLAGGAATQLVADSTPQQIAVDATAIYWASGSGRILKLAK